jgi:hypothetical protein
MKYKRMATTGLTGESDVRSPDVSCCASQKVALKALAYAYSIISEATATANTVIATGNLRQGRLMADHNLRQIGAKEGQGGMRARCFSYCKGGKRRGTVAG